MEEYRGAVGPVIEAATRDAQQSLSPAISVLRDIMTDPKENSNARIAAARSMLEYGLRLTEFNDILRELQSIQGDL